MITLSPSAESAIARRTLGGILRTATFHEMIPHHPDRKSRRFNGTEDLVEILSSSGQMLFGILVDESSTGLGLVLVEIPQIAVNERIMINHFGVPTAAIVRRVEPLPDGKIHVGCEWIVA